MRQMAIFDRAAGWYDRLSRLVLGTSLREAERFLLDHLADKGKILWVGGGTGELLPEMLVRYPNLEIDYLEISRGMLDRARKRVPEGDTRVRWLSDPAQLLQGDRYDAIWMAYVLDVFPENDLALHLNVWLTQIKPDGILLVTDFWKSENRFAGLFVSMLIRVMYLFFRIAIGLKTSGLPDWKGALYASGYEEERTGTTMMGGVHAGVWRARKSG